MVNVDMFRRLLALADVARDPYTVAEGAAALLGANPQDAVGAGHYLRALASLKLYAAARRLPHEGLRETIAGLPAAPSGAIPWASRARRFRANVNSLSQRYPEIAALLVRDTDALDRYELHQAGDGNYFVLDTQAPSLWTAWLAGLINHQNTDALWTFDRERPSMPMPMVFDGIGYGWLLQRVATTTERSLLSYSCALYVLEPDPIAFAMALHMHDFQALLADPRLRLFVGGTAEQVTEDFCAQLHTHRDWTPPQQVISNRLTPRAPIAAREMAEEILAERGKARLAMQQQCADLYAGKDQTHWYKRFAESSAGKGGPPLRVLGMTTRYSTVLQHSMRELREAVIAAGHEMQIAIEPDDQSLENPYLEMIASFKPDLLVQISRMRYENPALPRGVPFLCWDQDNLPVMRTPEATAGLDPLTFVAGHGAFHGYVYLGWPRRNCIICQPAAATHRYAPRPLGADLLARVAADFSYVSNASGSAEELRQQHAARWQGDPLASGVFQNLTDAVLTTSETGETWNAPRLHGLLEKVLKQRGATCPSGALEEMVMSAVTIADRVFRHAVLGWAADFCDAHGRTLRLYGQGWDRHPRFARYHAGVAGQGDELMAIYQASKINLQIIETGFLHSRAIDGLAAGGFFLTRRTDYDGLDREIIAARQELSLFIRRNGVTRVEQLEQAAEPQVRRRWQLVRDELNQLSSGAFFTPEALLRCVETFADTHAACVIFPQFDRIAFTNRSSFIARAEQFLGDDGARKKIAAEMRQVVLDHFSYDARWKQFLSGIITGLGQLGA